jgi:hypothetical protein
MLRRIAGHPIIADPANHGSLPPCWRTLYELTKLSNAVLLAALADGRVDSKLQRKDIRSRILGLPPKGSKSEPEAPDPVAHAVTVLKALSDTQLTAVWTAVTLAAFLRTISADMRSELERRIAGVRRAQGGDEPALQRESEILRQALSHVRIAAQPEMTPASAKLAEAQAMQALRMLAKALAVVDTDNVTLINRYAKASRCAKKTRRAA